MTIFNLWCSTAVVDCGSPPSISDGTSGRPSSTTFGGTVTYRCNNGYILSGSATVSCLASGSWDSTPECTGKIIFISSTIWLLDLRYKFKRQSLIFDVLLQLSTVIHRPPSPTELLGHHLAQPLEGQ